MENANNVLRNKERKNVSVFQPPIKGKKNGGNVKNSTKGFSNNKRSRSFKCN